MGFGSILKITVCIYMYYFCLKIIKLFCATFLIKWFYYLHNLGYGSLLILSDAQMHNKTPIFLAPILLHRHSGVSACTACSDARLHGFGSRSQHKSLKATVSITEYYSYCVVDE